MNTARVTSIRCAQSLSRSAAARSAAAHQLRREARAVAQHEEQHEQHQDETHQRADRAEQQRAARRHDDLQHALRAGDDPGLDLVERKRRRARRATAAAAPAHGKSARSMLAACAPVRVDVGRSSCEACAATAPPMAASGSTNSNTTPHRHDRAGERGRLPEPRRQAARSRAPAAAPSSAAHTSGCHSGCTMRQTRYASAPISSSTPTRAKNRRSRRAACGRGSVDGRLAVSSPAGGSRHCPVADLAQGFAPRGAGSPAGFRRCP